MTENHNHRMVTENYYRVRVFAVMLALLVKCYCKISHNVL